jgi:signal transduction histidine kinase
MDDSAIPPAYDFRDVLQSLPAIACLLGPDGTVLSVTQTWQEFYGVTAGPSPTAPGDDYLAACRQSDRPHTAELYEAVEQLLAGDRSTYRTTHPGPDPDQNRWYDFVGWRVELETEAHVIVTHLNTTAQTTAELTDQAEVKRLKSLARVLSHDLRTPLSVASGYCELLAHNNDSPHLDRIQEALERIETIAENAVFIARGTEIEATDMVSVDSLVTRVWGSLDTDSASLRIDDEITVEADRGLLSELLLNLFQNALDHASPAPTVTVGRLEDRAGFYVADDGPGITIENRIKVFDIGYTTGSGTGFGLDIVNRIVETHDWEIQIIDSSDGGARFEILTDEPGRLSEPS